MTSIYVRLIASAGLAVMLSGCGLLQSNVANRGPTLGDLQPVRITPEEEEPVPTVSLREIEQSYRAALDVAADPALRQRILVRLADLQMARSENRQLSQVEQEEHFAEAIALYDDLLTRAEAPIDEKTDERLLYRLSKAYALDGRMEESNAALERMLAQHPESAYSAEANFRRAELAFSQGRYRDAEELYAQVLSAGENTAFFLNSLYMHGWSLFKDNRFEESLSSFTQLLDRTFTEDATLDTLDENRKGLIADTLRVMAITFSYLEGAQSVTDTYTALGERHYQHLLYRRLGQLYLEKELYQEAAATYEHFIEQFPQSDLSPGFAVQVIDVYTQGGLAELVLPAKESFVRNYGVNSRYWAEHSEEQRRTAILPYLEIYLDELSSFYHAEAQKLKVVNERHEAAVARGGRPGPEPERATPAFVNAAEYYDQFRQTFPQSERLPEITFLMGEAYFDAEAFPFAVDAYEQVAFDFIDPQFGAEAGYSAILALQALTEQAVAEQQMRWQQRKADTAARFAEYYPGDQRAIVVLAEAAQTFFESGDSEQAMRLARQVTEWRPAPADELQKTAWLIIAHTQFDADDFNAAEQSYREVLARLPADSAERAPVQERIAASMFKSAEQLAAGQDLEQAVERLLRIDATAPGTDIAINAQYDAGNYLMDMQSWHRAEQVFTDFARRFPDHELAPTITPRLAVIYQESEQWDKAAGALALLASQSDDPEARRQSMYLSAEFYQRSGRTADAANQYEAYVKAYPQPFDLATEARYQLVQLAEVTKDRKAHDRWLRELVNAHDHAGGAATDRSRYLAAFAANEFAGDAYSRFAGIQLKLPIRNSLTAKQKALEETLAAYRKVMDYSVAEFATEANHRIGNVYAQLSRDLMDSERPGGLDELAMEQYEILLEEQAWPFEEKAIELLETNSQRAWDGLYDKWVRQSFAELARLLPARYGKQETMIEASHGIH